MKNLDDQSSNIDQLIPASQTQKNGGSSSNAQDVVGITTRFVPAGIHPTVYPYSLDGSVRAPEKSLRCRLVVTIGKKFESSETGKKTDPHYGSHFNVNLRTLPGDLHRHLFDERGRINAILQFPDLEDSHRPFPKKSDDASASEIEISGHRIFWGNHPSSDDHTSPMSDSELEALNEFWAYLIVGTRAKSEEMWAELASRINDSAPIAPGLPGSTPDNCATFKKAETALTKPTAETVGSILSRRAYALLSQVAHHCDSREETGFCTALAGNIEIGNQNFYYLNRVDTDAGVSDQKDKEDIEAQQSKLISQELKSKIDTARSFARSRLNYVTKRNPDTEDLQDYIKRKLTGETHPDCFGLVAEIGLDSDITKIQDANDSQRIQHTASVRKAGIPVNSDNQNANKSVGVAEAINNKLMNIQSNVRLSRLLGLSCDVEFDGLDELIDNIDTGKIASTTQVLTVDEATLNDSSEAPTERLLQGCYIFISSRPQNDQSNNWVLAKFLAPDLTTSRSIGHFYPCSREEIDFAWLKKQPSGPDLLSVKTQRAAIEHKEGIIDLGTEIKCSEDKYIPRYELTPLDAAPATEAEINQEYAELERSQYEEDPDRPTSNKKVLKNPEKLERAPLPTAGMLLLDRKMNVKMVDEIVRKSWRQKGCSDGGDPVDGIFLHDASDLMIGYSPDIAIKQDPNPENRLVWRSLSNRVIAIRDPRASRSIDPDWLESLVSRFDESFQTRVRTNAAISQTSASQVEHKYENENEMLDHLFVDQTVFRWNGDLVGIDTTPSVAVVKQDNDLPLTEIHFPLNSEDVSKDFLPPPGRFGQSYWFGCRAVYAGGVKVPLSEASARYNMKFDGELCMPKKRAPGKRFLRLEKIKAPVWMLKRNDVDKYRSDADNQIYEMPSSSTVTLRMATVDYEKIEQARREGIDVDGDKIERLFSTTSTTRILLPPSVALDFAGRHGVFDKNQNQLIVTQTNEDGVLRKLPKGAYLNVKMDLKPDGGFPITDSEGNIHDELLSPVPEGTRVGSGQLAPVLITKDDQSNNETKRERFSDRQEPVFGYKKFSKRDYVRKNQGYFFPDPAADKLVLKVRRTIDGKSYAGDPVVVDVSSRYEYPNLPAIHVNFKAINRIPKPDGNTRSHADVIKYKDIQRNHGYLNQKMEFKAGSVPNGSTPAINIDVELERGEDIEIVSWFAPSYAKLMHWFEVIESAATLLSCRENANEEECRRIIRTIFKGIQLDDYQNSNMQQLIDTSCGISGHARPHIDLIKDLAKAIARLHLKQPIEEISGPSIMKAVNAVTVPNFAPRFLKLESDNIERLENHRSTNFAFIRRHWTKPGENKDVEILRGKFLANHPISNWGRIWQDEDETQTIDTSHEIDAADLTIGGKILIDVDTVSKLQLSAEIFSPNSADLDSDSRGLTKSQRRKIFDIYSEHLQNSETESFRSCSNGAADEAAREILESQLGYHVLTDGTVIPKRDRIDLYEINDLALKDGIDELGSGVEIIDLNITYDSESGSNNASTVETENGTQSTRHVRKNSIRFIFRDTLSREITNLELKASSRFREHFNIKSPGDEPPDDAGQTIKDSWNRRLAIYDRYADLAQYLLFETSSSNDKDDEKAKDFCIPTTSRPPQPNLLSSTPSFLWEFDHNAGRPTQSANSSTQNQFTVTRNTKIRLYVKKPWFASGDNERLGIVLWPPEIFGGKHLASPDMVNPELPSSVKNMSDFGLEYANPPTDNSNLEEENNWSSYVTRWGNDPIRSGPFAEGWFVPRDVFDDIHDDADGSPAPCDEMPVLIPNAKIPLPGREKDGETNRKFFNASLLTYKLKFDIENKVWYVDLGLDPLDLPFPFMRLSLVRYQPCAIGDLHVSEPVTQWCQLMPKRRVTARKHKVAGKHYVDVTVEGRASDTSRSHALGGTGFNLGVDVDPTDRPAIQMSLRVQRPHEDLSGVIVDTALNESICNNSQSDAVTKEQWSWSSQQEEGGKWIDHARSEARGLVWKHRFEVDLEPKFPKPPSKQERETSEYRYIYIEEVQRMLGTNSTNSSDQDIEISGPRFSAVIPLRIDRVEEESG